MSSRVVTYEEIVELESELEILRKVEQQFHDRYISQKSESEQNLEIQKLIENEECQIRESQQIVLSQREKCRVLLTDLSVQQIFELTRNFEKQVEENQTASDLIENAKQVLIKDHDMKV